MNTRITTFWKTTNKKPLKTWWNVLIVCRKHGNDTRRVCGTSAVGGGKEIGSWLVGVGWFSPINSLHIHQTRTHTVDRGWCWMLQLTSSPAEGAAALQKTNGESPRSSRGTQSPSDVALRPPPSPPIPLSARVCVVAGMRILNSRAQTRTRTQQQERMRACVRA